MADGLPSGELPRIAKPEAPKVSQPTEIKAPEVKPMGQAEQTMVARIDKDGDPDLVLQDLTKVDTVQPTVSNPQAPESAINTISSGTEIGQPPQQASESNVEDPATWEQVFQSNAGKEFHNAMRGIGVDGRQDVTGSRITTDYSMREFVRRHPQEAQQYMDIFQKEFGRQHPDLVRATQQVTELQQNPPQVPPEDPKYAGLAYRLDQDDEYGKLRDELNTAHKVKVFGTTDFNSIPLDRFMDLASSDANMLFSADREAEKVFRQSHQDRAALYDERERIRVYRDPDGVINRDRDPLFLKMFEPDSRGIAWTREEGMRRFALMYPDKARGYAERYPDLQPYLKNDVAIASQPEAAAILSTGEESKPPQAEAPKPEMITASTPAKALAEKLQADGVESRVIPIANTGELTEAVILPKKEVPTEKMVRVYRGVNQLDASLLQQIPYAMRADSEDSWGSVVMDSVRQDVDTLAAEPTYEHLLTYVNKARPQLTETQQRRLDKDLAKIEDGILKGYSVRTELIYDQIGHNGGSADSGISPYLSASWSPREALGYTRSDGALLVIDVPISQIEDFGKDGTETNIKGALDSKYITAIIPRNGMDLRDNQVSEQAIATALQTVTESAQVPLYDTAEAQTVRGHQIATNQEEDKQQQQIDAEAVRQKRTASLFSQFSEVGLSSQTVEQTATESGTDIYTKTKTDIFDYYAGRLSKLGRGGRNAADYEYVSETEYGARKKFDRANVTDEMLLQLRTNVQRQEQREQERANNR